MKSFFHCFAKELTANNFQVTKGKYFSDLTSTTIFMFANEFLNWFAIKNRNTHSGLINGYRSIHKAEFRGFAASKVASGIDIPEILPKNPFCQKLHFPYSN